MKKYYLLLNLLLLSFLNVFAQDGNRRNSIQECLEVQSPNIQIELWDAGVEDNDTVTVYLNGKETLSKVRLSKARQTFNLELQPGDNKLSLFANNLGDIPNNTAAIAINGGKAMSLKSGLEVNGAMNLRYMAPGFSFTQQQCEVEKIEDDKEAASIRSNPTLAMPSYAILQNGLRLNANETARKVEIQDCYNSSARKVKLWYWDCGVEDNDTVSLNLNGTWILQNTRLTKEPKFIEVTLQSGENILSLYAHNLGDIPKNTAALSVESTFIKNEVGKMISDANTCGAIRINYGMTDSYGNSIPPCLDENTVDSTSEPEMVYLNNLKLTQPNSNTSGTRTTPTNPRNSGSRNGTYHPGSYPPIVVPVPRPVPTPKPSPAPSTKPSPRPVPTPKPSTKPSTPPSSPAPNTTPGTRSKPKPAY